MAEGRRLLWIDSLRGFSCLWVILYHATLFGYLPQIGTADPLLEPLHNAWLKFAQLGYMGVLFFLVLSGYCLTLPLLKGGQVQKLDAKRFFLKRAVRILPPYYAALALWTAVVYLPWFGPVGRPTLGWYDLVSHVFLFHNLNFRTADTVNGAFWSIALECQLYLVFPILVAVLIRNSAKALALGALFVTIAWQRFANLGVGPHPKWANGVALYYNPAGLVFVFVAGMVAAVLMSRPRPHQREAALLVISIAMPAAVLEMMRSWPSHFTQLGDPLWAIVFAAAVVAIGSAPTGFKSSWPMIQLARLGRISYSVYLVHLPLMAMVFCLAPRAPFWGPTTAIFTFVGLPLILGFGALFYAAFEAPSLRWLSRLKQSPPVSEVGAEAKLAEAPAGS